MRLVRAAFCVEESVHLVTSCEKIALLFMCVRVYVYVFICDYMCVYAFSVCMFVFKVSHCTEHPISLKRVDT